MPLIRDLESVYAKLDKPINGSRGDLVGDDENSTTIRIMDVSNQLLKVCFGKTSSGVQLRKGRGWSAHNNKMNRGIANICDEFETTNDIHSVAVKDSVVVAGRRIMFGPGYNRIASRLVKRKALGFCGKPIV